jgi:hypothetical protein
MARMPQSGGAGGFSLWPAELFGYDHGRERVIGHLFKKKSRIIE